MSKKLTEQAARLPAHLQEPPAWLAKLSESGNFVSPAKQNDPDAAFEAGISFVQLAGIRLAMGGFWLERAKALSGGGRKWVRAKADSKSVSPESCYTAMRYFNFLNDVGEEEAIRQIASLGYTVVDEQLRKLGADGARRLAQGEKVAGLTWDEFCSSSRNDLRNHMRQLQAEREEVLKAERRADDLAKRLDKTNAELERYRQQEIQLGKLPPSVRRARVEGGGMAMTFNEMFSHLTELANDVFHGSDLHSDHRKRQQQLTLAVDSLAIVARGAAAQAALLLQLLEERAPGAISDTEEALPIMDRAEALAAYHRFRSMLANADYSLDTALLNGAKRKRK